MCGICGFIDHLDVARKHDVITEMTERIAHRGPDGQTSYVDEHAALGHRRLSIIDLEHGTQPMFNEDQSLVVTFNGEIYNYQELQQELIQAGHSFASNCDTEVLVHGYEQWGKGLLNKLRGMFAFVIWDKAKQELFGARDFFGIKPLYYAQMNGTFMYASEIKALLAHPKFEKEFNPEPLESYLILQYNSSDETFFKGVYALPPAHYFKYVDGQLRIERYADIHQTEGHESLTQIVNDIDTAVEHSVAAHKIADVEVGSFLSAGVDSSYVASVLRPDHTFSVGFDTGQFNEAVQAKALSEKLDLHNDAVTVNAKQAFQYFNQIQWHLDEPDGNPSCVPLFFVSKLASQHVKVVMSGEGADELFAGYQTYGFYTKSVIIRLITQALTHLPRHMRYALANWMKDKHFPGRLHMYLNLSNPDETYTGNSKVFSKKEAQSLLQPQYRDLYDHTKTTHSLFKSVQIQGLSDIKRKQFVDMNFGMVKDILLKADKMSMANSLELRVPILDKEVFTVSERVPSRYLMNWRNSKFAFRQAANRHLPDEWANREKMGFPVPIKDWLREEQYYLRVRSLFAQPWVKQFFNQGKLLSMIDNNYAEKTNDRRKIWTIFSFLTWYDVYFNHDGRKPQLVQ